MLKLFIDSDCEFTPEDAALYGATLITMPYELKGKDYTPFVNINISEYHAFYDELRKGNLPSTSALSPETYIEYFEPEFAKGNDILYVHFSSAMSGTFNSMRLALDELAKKYPDRKFYACDTKGITIEGYVIAKQICKLYKEGKTAEELIKWNEENNQKFACYFFADDLKFFKKSGRVSGIAAFFGNIFGVKPIINMNAEGKMGAVGKVKGRKNAVDKIVDYMVNLGDNFENYDLVIGHTDNEELVNELKKAIEEKFSDKKLNIEIILVNPTIGGHCGPDAIGICFRSKCR